MEYFFDKKVENKEYTELNNLVNQLKHHKQNKKQDIWTDLQTSNFTKINNNLLNIANTIFVLDLINTLARSNAATNKNTQNEKYYILSEYDPNKEAIESIIKHLSETLQFQNLETNINSLVTKIKDGDESDLSKLQGYYDRRKYAAKALKLIGQILMLSAILAVFTSGLDAALALVIIGAIIYMSRKIFTKNVALSEELKEKTNTKNIKLDKKDFQLFNADEDTQNKINQLIESTNSSLSM